MAIVLGQSDRYWYPVSVQVPADDGRTGTIKLEARFNRVGQARVTDLIERMRAEEDPLRDADLVREVLCGWRNVVGVETSAGKAPDYDTPDEREALLDIVGVQSALVRAWFDSLTQGKRKN